MLDEPDIGRVFTPIKWASWLLEETGAYRAWLQGALIADPNFGGGAFIVSLLELAERDQITVSDDMISRIFGYEIRSGDREQLLHNVKERFGLDLIAKNFANLDVLSPDANMVVDVVVGNPPWANFTALPKDYKEKWAEKFIEYGLVGSKKDVLLGSSRADICALVTKKVLDDNLSSNGMFAAFMPLSIFFNSGSNDLFRPFPGSDHSYAVTEIWDFVDEKVFDGVATRYGAAKFVKGETQEWPVVTHVREGESWKAALSTSSDGRHGFWQRHRDDELVLRDQPKINVKQGQQPRQGINTCGANDILIFTSVDDNIFQNQLGETVELEADLLLPLIDKSCFSASAPKGRLILAPHSSVDGKPLSLRELRQYPKTHAYLSSKKNVLEHRKGTMINAHIKRGIWWALLGVGPYSYSKWKVVWEALGKSVFDPKVLPGIWQGNQALHAFFPCDSEQDAQRLANELRDPAVENYLKASAMGGTMNWAQPGRIAKLLVTEQSQASLFA
jgi:hypothetical protein